MECFYDGFWVRGEGGVRYTGFYGVFLRSAPSVSVEIYAICPRVFAGSLVSLDVIVCGLYLIVKFL